MASDQVVQDPIPTLSPDENRIASGYDGIGAGKKSINKVDEQARKRGPARVRSMFDLSDDDV
jgi:hypothetical protein